MEVVVHINLSLSFMAFSNFYFLIKITNTEWTTLYLHSHFSNVWIDANQNWNMILIGSHVKHKHCKNISSSIKFLPHFANGNVSFAITWRPSSVNFLHFNVLLQNRLSKLNEQKLGSYRNHLWKVFYKNCSFCFDPLTNMTNTSNSYFWLVDF